MQNKILYSVLIICRWLLTFSAELELDKQIYFNINIDGNLFGFNVTFNKLCRLYCRK